MKTIFTSLLISLLGLSNSANANVGVFTGYGHTIELASTEEIQMLSEEITIIPGRGRFLFDGGIPGMDRVEYACIFVLKNLKGEKVSIQAGFPLNAEFLSHGSGKDRKVGELVARYNFISQIEGHQYTVRYVPAEASLLSGQFAQPRERLPAQHPALRRRLASSMLLSVLKIGPPRDC